MNNINGTQLDPTIVKVMKAIRDVESGGDYNAVGDDGAAFGAFQYNEKTGPGWKNMAKQYLGDENAPFDKANQNQVTYKRFEQWKNEGKGPEEIAALHNGAYKDKDGKYQYNNPEYGVKFRNALLGGTQAPQQAAQGSSGAYPLPPEIKPVEATQNATGDMAQAKDKSFAQKGLEFLFPILEDKERTPLQTIGDVALSGMTLIPAAGAFKAGSVGLKAGKALLPKLLQNAVGEGLTLGYGADVATNLSQGETGGEVLKPGIGTAVGGLGGTLLGTAKKIAGPLISKATGVSRGALEHAADNASKVKGLINTSAKDSREPAVRAITGLRKSMSENWEKGVQTIVDKYKGVRVGLPETVKDELIDIAGRYNTSTKTRINIPQNVSSLGAKELTDLIKDINGIKYNPLQPDIPLKDMKAYLKGLGNTNFNTDKEFTNLYSNYATKSAILENADDIVKAFKAKKPTQITTAINKLQSVFDEGKDEYLQAIKALEKETGIDILSGVAANKTSQIMPRTFGGDIGLDDIIKLMGFPLASPRMGTEILRLLTGRSASKLAPALRGASQLVPLLSPKIEQ